MLEFTLTSGFGFAGNYYEIKGYLPGGEWYKMAFYGYSKRNAIAKFRAENNLKNKHICFNEW